MVSTFLGLLQMTRILVNIFPSNEILSLIGSLVGKTIMPTQVKVFFFFVGGRGSNADLFHFLSPFLVIHIESSSCAGILYIGLTPAQYCIFWFRVCITLNFLEFKVLSAFSFQQYESSIALPYPLCPQLGLVWIQRKAKNCT